MRRVIERTVVWRHRDTRKVSTVRYFVAATDRYTDQAATHTTGLLPEEEAAIEAYGRACEEGVAQLLGRPAERGVE